MYIGKIETSNFSFMSLGNTEQEAMQALKKGWRKHTQQYINATLKFEELDASVIPISVGEYLRDNSPF